MSNPNAAFTFTLDPVLEQYATTRQWELLTAWSEEGSQAAGAKKLKCNKKNIVLAKRAVFAKAAKQGYSPQHDMTRQVPEGYNVKGVSTYYNKDGNATGQWVKSQVDKGHMDELFAAALEAFASDLPKLPLMPAPKHGREDLMACYPVGDHHMGLLVWAEECDADYDIKIAEELLLKCANYLMAGVPNTETAILAFLGDFLHYDGFEPVTPTSRNVLDADGRYPKMVRAAVRVIRALIEMAAKKHNHVKVIIEIGNHDLSTSIFLMEVLSNVYENNPRITIDTHPGHFHYHKFGNNLIGTHHGHGSKLADLPLIMATDRPKDWGDTEHRYIWTGHVHHAEIKDVKGCQVESFRVLAAADAYAFNKGYRSKRDMKAILIHKDHGEVARYTVSPDIVEGM